MPHAKAIKSLVGILLGGLLLLGGLVPAPTSAQMLSEFPEIYTPDLGMLDNYQVKITYLGPQKKAVPSLGLAGMARQWDLLLFDPWHVDYDYGNDEVMDVVLTIPGQDLLMFMDFIMGDPMLQSTARIPEPDVSFMIFTEMPMVMCWEHVAELPEADVMFQMLADSMSDPLQQEDVHRFRRQMTGVRR